MLEVILKDNDLPKKLRTARKVWIPEEMENNLDQFVGDIITEATQYPPKTEANQPPPPYYQRGVGYYGRSGNLTKLSEQLDERWEYEIRDPGDGIEAVIRNRASYSAWVQDREFQVPWHAARGWRTVQDIVDDKVDGNKLVNRIKDFIGKIISRL